MKIFKKKLFLILISFTFQINHEYNDKNGNTLKVTGNNAINSQVHLITNIDEKIKKKFSGGGPTTVIDSGTSYISKKPFFQNLPKKYTIPKSGPIIARSRKNGRKLINIPAMAKSINTKNINMLANSTNNLVTRYNPLLKNQNPQKFISQQQFFQNNQGPKILNITPKMIYDGKPKHKRKKRKLKQNQNYTSNPNLLSNPLNYLPLGYNNQITNFPQQKNFLHQTLQNGEQNHDRLLIDRGQISNPYAGHRPNKSILVPGEQFNLKNTSEPISSDLMKRIRLGKAGSILNFYENMETKVIEGRDRLNDYQNTISNDNVISKLVGKIYNSLSRLDELKNSFENKLEAKINQVRDIKKVIRSLK